MNYKQKTTMCDRPNLLFLFTDDQRFDTISALGNREIVTPNLDLLVRGGTAFTRAHIMGGSCGAVCMPSRAMLMTGRTLFHLHEQGQSIPREHALMGEVFRQAGYETFGTGKWHNGPDSYTRSFSSGGEIFFGGMNDHWNVPACDFDPQGRYFEQQAPYCTDMFHSNETRPRPVDHIIPGKHSTELFSDATVNFLDRHDGNKPFFAYVSFMAPHDPRTMPQKYRDMYPPESITFPDNYMPGHPFDNGCLRIRDEALEQWPRTKDAIQRHMAEYYAMITHVDAEIGRILGALESNGYSDNTIIVFAGDNGLAVGQHGLMGKQSLYDHSVRVPLLFAGPGIPQNVQSEAQCYLLDVFPTLCDMVGIGKNKTVEGKSLGPVLRGESKKHREYLHLAYEKVHRGVTDSRYKLIEYVVNGSRMTQLFDLVNDPFEQNNIANESAYGKEMTRLRKELLHWKNELDDPFVNEGEFWNIYQSQTETRFV